MNFTSIVWFLLLTYEVQAFELPVTLYDPQIIFECTAISEPKLRGITRDLEKIGKYTSIRLDSQRKDGLVLSIGKNRTLLNSSNVRRKISGLDRESILVHYNGRLLIVDISGKPLSRNGVAKISSEAGSIESRVTCH